MITERIALPIYNAPNYDYDTCTVTPEVAEKIAARVLELGADHAFHKATRFPTPEEQAAYAEDRLDNYLPKRDRYSRVIIVYVRGPVEQACEEFDIDPCLHANRAAVDVFLAPVRGAKKQARTDEARKALEDHVEAFCASQNLSPALERYVRSTFVYGARGVSLHSSLRPADMTDTIKGALARRQDQWGKVLPAYTPEASGFTLATARAFSGLSTQEAYADHSTTIIPLDVRQPTDVEAARRNLGQIARRMGTHTGLAGSGSTWSFEVIAEEDGAFAILSGRHSICD